MVLKSGKIHTADSMVLKNVTWPHELIYKAEDKPAQNEDFSMSQFVSGYMAVMNMEKPAVRTVMGST